MIEIIGIVAEEDFKMDVKRITVVFVQDEKVSWIQISIAYEVLTDLNISQEDILIKAISSHSMELASAAAEWLKVNSYSKDINVSTATSFDEVNIGSVYSKHYVNSVKYQIEVDGKLWESSSDKVNNYVSQNYPFKDSFQSKINLLPGLDVKVKHPPLAADDKFMMCIKINRLYPLKDLIVHLNDRHKWSRSEIADWLEEISDSSGKNGPDLRFKVPEKTN